MTKDDEESGLRRTAVCEEALKHTELFVRRVDLSQNAQLCSDQEALGYRLGSCRAVQMHSQRAGGVGALGCLKTISTLRSKYHPLSNTCQYAIKCIRNMVYDSERSRIS